MLGHKCHIISKRRTLPMKSRVEQLKKQLGVQREQIKMLEKLNKQMFEDKHKAEERIMELESELAQQREVLNDLQYGNCQF